MKKLEYLIFESALISPSGYSHFINNHKFTEEEVASTIFDLLSREEIFIYWENFKKNPLGLQIKKSLSEDEFFEGLHQQRGVILVTYALTLKGGLRWEQKTNPRWDNFFESRNYLNRKKASKTALNRGLIEELFFLLREMDSDIIPIQGTEIWSEITDWKALYWKVFPQAVKVDYDIHSRRAYPMDVRDVILQMERSKPARERYAFIRKWYDIPNF